MTPETTEVEAHIAAVAPEDGVAEVFRLLASAPLNGFSRHIQSKALAKHDLRFIQAGHWLASAVLNPGWVLIYLRRPAFREAGLQQDAVMALFPEARVAAGEVKLRLTDANRARELLAVLAGAEAMGSDPISEAIDE